jgi:hypothetical protein
MERVDGVGDASLVNDYYHPGMNRNEILVRHGKLLAVGQLEGEGLKTIM